MTRINLGQTCLLEVSGELSLKAQDKLHEQIAQYPAALLEYEVVRGQFGMLRSLPTFEDELSLAQCQGIRNSIRGGIQKAVVAERRERLALRRRTTAYRMLSGISAVAACVIVGVGFLAVRQKFAKRRARVRQDELALREMAYDNFRSSDALPYRRIAHAIARIEQSPNALMASRSRRRPVMQLLDALDGSSRASQWEGRSGR